MWILGLMMAPWGMTAPVSPSDPNVQLTGRWDRSNPTQPWAFAQGSSVIVNFSGTSIAATIGVTEGDSFRVIIDDDAMGSVKVIFSSGESQSLAKDLIPGNHKLELVKETDQGRATLLGLEVDDGQTLLSPPARPNRRIVFYGDSNLAGASLESERNEDGWNFVGSYFGYSGITARMFGAECQNISRSGATISSLRNAFDRIDWRIENPSWDFSINPADVVVVNIGANDAWSPKDQNKTGYHALLDDLREVHPDAHIVLFNAYGWDANEPANYTQEVVAERGDSKLSAALFPWVFEQYHGCQTDHSGMAHYLAAHLSDVTNWTAERLDVVSGFGVNGNVANGSFEETAPFGGWGWRYFDDLGVSRVFDPVGAPHGSYVVRLIGGGSLHQTNPASDGDVVSVTMWMKANHEGNQVDVSVSFRDQDGGGEINAPIEETTQTKTLSTFWEHYSMTVAAPIDHPNPVMSVRVTLTAGPEATVDIDRVVASRVNRTARRGSGRSG